jgi:catechol 2,3-dioxygenase-like lactoylglutathione lyase family enzyme
VTARRIVPDLQLKEPDQSREFYAEVLGLRLEMDMGWILTFVSPVNPTAQVTLISEDATAAVLPEVSIEVEDVDGVHAKAVERGLEIVHPLTDEPWGVRRFFVRDPNGAVINVMTHPDPELE